MEREEHAWDQPYLLQAIVLLFWIRHNDKLSSRTLTTKPPSVYNHPYQMLTDSWKVELPEEFCCAQKTEQFYSKFKVVVSLVKSLLLKSRALYGHQMVPRLPLSANTELSLPIDNSNNCVPSATTYASSLVHGMFLLPNYLFTLPSTTSSTVCHREIPEPFVPSINHFTLLDWSRINCFVSIAKPAHALLALMLRKQDSSLPLPTNDTDKSCKWSVTAVFVDAQSSHTFNPRDSQKLHSTLCKNLKLVSAWRWLAVTLKLPWKVHLL
mmetsp:Transcript_777/g.1100  ORF Transcript_777/g.1100 Transcript_777/m.1100 type:complete len:267 (+) Transcript_777:200-1000(+)